MTLPTVRADPASPGALLQATMDPSRRHRLGAHFTGEADIARIVEPTIVRPWLARIAAARTSAALRGLHDELCTYRILDPACGAGDFLHAALGALQTIEREVARRLGEPLARGVGAGQLFGIDADPAAVALARTRLREASVQEGDALFMPWPAVDAIVGNPPFQAKNKMQGEFGADYVRRLRARYPEISGMADYCVYFFRRAHDELPPGGRAGLVGTNTIRQNQSRAGGLDHIVRSGEIVEAVSSQVWGGDAGVHVSVVNWVKQRAVPGPRILWWQEGDTSAGRWHSRVVAAIGPSLSPDTEVGAAVRLRGNDGWCFQGQTPGHAGFLLTPAEARELADDSATVVFPLMIGDDLLGRSDGAPGRHVIDFGARDELQARAFTAAYQRVAARVLPDRRAALQREQARNAGVPGRGNHHHAAFHARWWQLSYRRPELLAAIAPLPRYIACARLSRRPIFEFVDSAVRPGDALVVFALADDYSFGVLQSEQHWRWFTARCSTLKADFRYTSRTVFDAFPWPQAPTLAQVAAVAAAGRELRALRRALALPRRSLYRAPDPSLRAAHDTLDRAVAAAYGMPGDADVLAFLLAHNLELAHAEARGLVIQGPGPPAIAAGVAGLVSHDRIVAPRG